MRARHTTLQRTFAEETDGLKAANLRVAQRAEAVARETRREVRECVDSARKEAGHHVEYRKRVEILERGSANALRDCLEDVREKSASREGALFEALRALKGKCAAHRRRRGLALNGLKADLSLMSRKLDMLEPIAEEVYTDLVLAARGRRASQELCLECAEGSGSASFSPPLRPGPQGERYLLDNGLAAAPRSLPGRRRSGRGIRRWQSLLGAGRARAYSDAEWGGAANEKRGDAAET